MIVPPILRRERFGHNAWHNAFCIRIRRDLPNFGAVLAQEVYEWRFLAVRGLPVTIALLGLAWLFASWPLPLLLTPIALMAGQSFPYFVGSWTREMELRGHMVEVLLSVDHYGADYGEKFEHEARSLQAYRQFTGWSIERLRSELDARDMLAARWIRTKLKNQLPASE